MESLDLALRMMACGAMLLVLCCVALREPGAARTWCYAALFAGISSYLALSAPGNPLLDSTALPVLVALGATPPLMLWLLARLLFDDGFRVRPVHLAAIIAMGLVAGAGAGSPLLPLPARGAIADMLRLVNLLVIAHAGWSVLAGRADDLLERRRRLRTLAVLLAGLQVIGIIAVELVIGDPGLRAALGPLNAVLILGLVLFFGAAWLAPEPLERVPRVLPAGGVVATPPEAADPVPAHVAADPVSVAALDRVIAAGGLFEADLTVAALAARAGMPEYRLRRLINQERGFRNFNAFLNAHRIAEAQRRLADPTQARLPVLTIALDLGYGSVGPFNRAFKAATGLTPTEYRQQRLAGTLAGS